MKFDKNMKLFIASIGDEANKYAAKLVKKVRDAGIYAEKDIMERSLKAQFKYADKKNAEFVVTIGDDEVNSGKGVLKNMATGDQKEIELDNIVNEL